jgi:hypothetical protein
VEDVRKGEGSAGLEVRTSHPERSRRIRPFARDERGTDSMLFNRIPRRQV